MPSASEVIRRIISGAPKLGEIVSQAQRILDARNAHKIESTRGTLDNLCLPKAWDYGTFEKVLVSSAQTSLYPTASPDTINVEPMSAKIDQIWQLTEKSGCEHARTGYVDLPNQRLIYCRYIKKGEESRVMTYWLPPEGRKPSDFSRCFVIHSHPGSISRDINTSLHFSGDDYKSFLSDPEQGAFYVVTAKNLMMALKTSSTPRRIEIPTLEARVSSLEREFLSTFYFTDRQYFNANFAFTKTVCLEFGMSLYLGSERNRNLMERVTIV